MLGFRPLPFSNLALQQLNFEFRASVKVCKFQVRKFQADLFCIFVLKELSTSTFSWKISADFYIYKKT